MVGEGKELRYDEAKRVVLTKHKPELIIYASLSLVVLLLLEVEGNLERGFQNLG